MDAQYPARVSQPDSYRSDRDEMWKQVAKGEPRILFAAKAFACFEALRQVPAREADRKAVFGEEARLLGPLLHELRTMASRRSRSSRPRCFATAYVHILADSDPCLGSYESYAQHDPSGAFTLLRARVMAQSIFALQTTGLEALYNEQTGYLVIGVSIDVRDVLDLHEVAARPRLIPKVAC